MAQATRRSDRKPSGGRYKSIKGKKKFELARFPTMTKIGKDSKVKSIRVRGGNTKLKVLTTATVNVTDKAGKTKKTEATSVLENPANPNLVRRNIITKGATIETPLGKALVTSRPGQDGVVNAKLVE
tara:strand:+ start:1095 stop:1475 length:381 start_codon:yes stop_codon:yes gene_type:complete